jgi:hypothetical protein
MIMSRDQNAGKHNMKTDDSSFERVVRFNYLGILMNQNSIQEDIKSKFKSGNALQSL